MRTPYVTFFFFSLNNKEHFGMTKYKNVMQKLLVIFVILIVKSHWREHFSWAAMTALASLNFFSARRLASENNKDLETSKINRGIEIFFTTKNVLESWLGLQCHWAELMINITFIKTEMLNKNQIMFRKENSEKGNVFIIILMILDF